MSATEAHTANGSLRGRDQVGYVARSIGGNPANMRDRRSPEEPDLGTGP